MDNKAQVIAHFELSALALLVDRACYFASAGQHGMNDALAARLVTMERAAKLLAQTRPRGGSDVTTWVNWQDLVALELARRMLVASTGSEAWEAVRVELNRAMDVLALAEGSLLELAIGAVEAAGTRPTVQSVGRKVEQLLRGAAADRARAAIEEVEA